MKRISSMQSHLNNSLDYLRNGPTPNDEDKEALKEITDPCITDMEILANRIESQEAVSQKILESIRFGLH